MRENSRHRHLRFHPTLGKALVILQTKNIWSFLSWIKSFDFSVFIYMTKIFTWSADGEETKATEFDIEQKTIFATG